jgi:hypothetical protein
VHRQYEWEAVLSRRPPGKWQQREVLAEMRVDQVGAGGQAQQPARRRDRVELTGLGNRQAEPYDLRPLADALAPRRRRRQVVPTVCLKPRWSSARLSSAVWFCIPPMGSNERPPSVRASSRAAKAVASRTTGSGGDMREN